MMSGIGSSVTLGSLAFKVLISCTKQIETVVIVWAQVKTFNMKQRIVNVKMFTWHENVVLYVKVLCLFYFNADIILSFSFLNVPKWYVPFMQWCNCQQNVNPRNTFLEEGRHSKNVLFKQERNDKNQYHTSPRKSLSIYDVHKKLKVFDIPPLSIWDRLPSPCGRPTWNTPLSWNG